MIKFFSISAILFSMSTAGQAAVFEYTSDGISELDYFDQFTATGGFIYPADFPNRRSNVLLRIEVNEPLRKNRTYTYNDRQSGWSALIIGGATGTPYSILNPLMSFLEVSITTNGARNVVNWDIDMEYGSGPDVFRFSSTPTREQTSGEFEYFDKDCIDFNNGDSTDCFDSELFGSVGSGNWTTPDPQVVPLPAASALLFSGLIGLGLTCRRKSKTQTA